MLPTNGTEPFTIIKEKDRPSKTYKMNLDKLTVQGYIDSKEAVKQAIYKILQSERYEYNQIYSDNYGVEFKNLYGMPSYFAIPMIEQKITEALTWDERILSVTNFEFTTQKNKISVKFIANTIYGNVPVEDLVINI